MIPQLEGPMAKPNRVQELHSATWVFYNSWKMHWAVFKGAKLLVVTVPARQFPAAIDYPAIPLPALPMNYVPLPMHSQYPFRLQGICRFQIKAGAIERSRSYVALLASLKAAMP